MLSAISGSAAVPVKSPANCNLPFVVVVASGMVATAIAEVTNSVVAIAVVLSNGFWVIAVVPEGKTGVPVNVGESANTTFPVPVEDLSWASPNPFPTNTFPFPILDPNKDDQLTPLHIINSDPVVEEQSVQYTIKPFVGVIENICCLVILGGRNPLVLLSISKIALGFNVKGLSPIFWAPCATNLEEEIPINKKQIVIFKKILCFILLFYSS